MSSSSPHSSVVRAVVTGANKGIGLEIAKELSSQGMHVILACRNTALGNVAAEEIRRTYSNIVDVMELDISKPESITKFAADIASNGWAIDILVNNAAIAFKQSDPTPFKDQAEPTFNTNLFGTLQVILSLLPAVKASSRKVIVNLASMAGHLMIFPSGSAKKALMESAATDLTIDGLVALSKEFVESVKNGTNVEEGWPKTCYGASKCAIIALTKIISRIEPSVVINSCCPGYCATDMTSHRGTKSAAEGAKTPVMLANFLPGGPTGRFFSECREVEW